MNKIGLTILLVLAALLIALALAWQNRVNLLVKILPVVTGFIEPVQPNMPITWPAGPDEAFLPPDQRPPNIILVLADDMGFNDVSHYNGGAADGTVMTPNIDAIAKQGVTFTNGYAGNAVCASSRATLMTGRYSTRFGFEFTPFPKSGVTIAQWLYDMAPEGALPVHIDHDATDARPEMRKLGMPQSEITIAEVLKSVGYYTAQIGKWHLGSNEMHPTRQGFDDSLNMLGMLYDHEDSPNIVNSKQPSNGIDRMVWASAFFGSSFNNGPAFEPASYMTDYYTDQAVKVIEKNRHRPFFLYLAHWAIHNPLQATKDDYEEFAHIEDHALRVYAGMIHSLDRSVGRVQATLKRLGLADNTLIIFTSDNGGAGYIGLPDVNKPYRGWKLTHFEGGIKVPFMASWPARIPAGTVVSDPVHHIDILATIAAAAEAQVPSDRKLDGVNLLPWMTGLSQDTAPHDSLFWRQGHLQTVQHQGWKLIREGWRNKHWLFNLKMDPTEQSNLADYMPEKVASMAARLDAHNVDQMPTAFPSIINTPQLVDKHHLLQHKTGDEYIYWPN